MKQAELQKLLESDEGLRNVIDHAIHHLRKMNPTKWNDRTEREMLCLIYNNIKNLDTKV